MRIWRTREREIETQAVLGWDISRLNFLCQGRNLLWIRGGCCDGGNIVLYYERARLLLWWMVYVCGVFHQRREDAYYTTTRAWPWNYDGAHLLPAGSSRRGERRGSLPKSCQEIPLSVQRAKKPPLIKGSRWCAVWLKRLREIFNWLPRRLNPVNFNF